MVKLARNALCLACPDVHEDAVCTIAFQRTLRIPNDGRPYPLPAGLGEFPLEYTEQYASRAPRGWRETPGFFFPMYQAEAMWISFGGFTSASNYPFALKIAAGEIDAVNGCTVTEGLSRSEQDYVVLPDQPWLDGLCAERSCVRQFVAMPLGAGYTTGEQLNTRPEHGGMHFTAYPMKRELYEERQRVELDAVRMEDCGYGRYGDVAGAMAPAGRLERDIYDDPYGVDAWDLRSAVECTVHIANSRDYLAITGRCPPTALPTEHQYRNAGIPWFKAYNTDIQILRGSPRLAGLDRVAENAGPFEARVA